MVSKSGRKADSKLLLEKKKVLYIHSTQEVSVVLIKVTSNAC